MLDTAKNIVWTQTWDGKEHGIARLVKFDYEPVLLNGQSPVSLSRIVRNPSGILPALETP